MGVVKQQCCRVALAMLLALWPAGAGAQVLTRPSKGATMTVFDAVTAASSTSSVYDWTAFESAIVEVCRGTGCTDAGGSIVYVDGASAVGGPFNVIADPNSQISTSSGYAYLTVSNLPAFIRFRMTVASSVATTVKITPIPFAIRKEVSGGVAHGAVAAGTVYPVLIGGQNTGAATISTMGVDSDGTVETRNTGAIDTASTIDTIASVTNAADGGTTVAAAAATGVHVHSTIVQNLGTVALACSAGGLPVIGTKGIVLKAATAANDGTGGSVTWTDYTGEVRCIAAGAGGSAAVQRW